ncbi:hypothetical protein [uncultured Gammaproteobacteria bacterium]|nr:hypothetical protein [uncultured Gammaproteobacteria bacterium]
MEHILRNVLLTLLDQEFRINNTKKFPKIYYKILIKGGFLSVSYIAFAMSVIYVGVFQHKH